MICFVLHEHHPYAVANFIDGWGRDIRPRVKVCSYQALRYTDRLLRGTYVFGDVDRLTDGERAFATHLSNTLIDAGCRVLNRPDRVAWRHELARRLQADGINSYRCFRADEDWSSVRFPVFVRREDDHGSLRRELLNDIESVRREIAAIDAPPSQILVVEFVDTRGPDGIYRKYSAIRVGGAPFPRHLLFSKDWVVKYADLLDEPLLAEERRYFDGFAADTAHARQVARVFELAEVEYGRIDYALTPDGRIQVWEINLSPNLGSPPNKIALGRLVSQWHISAQMVAAIAALDAPSGPPVRLPRDRTVLAGAGVTQREEWLRTFGKIACRVERLPLVRPMCDAYRRARWMATR